MNRYYEYEHEAARFDRANAKLQPSRSAYSFHPVDDPDEAVNKVFSRLPIMDYHSEDERRDDSDEEDDDVSSGPSKRKACGSMTDDDVPVCKRTRRLSNEKEEPESQRHARNQLWKASLRRSLFASRKL